MTFLLVQIELEFLIVHRLGYRNCNTSCRLPDQAPDGREIVYLG